MAAMHVRTGSFVPTVGGDLRDGRVGGSVMRNRLTVRATLVLVAFAFGVALAIQPLLGGARRPSSPPCRTGPVSSRTLQGLTSPCRWRRPGRCRRCATHAGGSAPCARPRRWRPPPPRRRPRLPRPRPRARRRPRPRRPRRRRHRRPHPARRLPRRSPRPPRRPRRRTRANSTPPASHERRDRTPRDSCSPAGPAVGRRGRVARGGRNDRRPAARRVLGRRRRADRRAGCGTADDRPRRLAPPDPQRLGARRRGDRPRLRSSRSA